MLAGPFFFKVARILHGLASSALRDPATRHPRHRQGAGRRATAWHPAATPLLEKHLPGAAKETMDFLLGISVDHVDRSLAIGAQHPWRGAKKTADQRALLIHLTTVLPQVRATELGQGGSVLSFRLDRQSGHFLCRHGDRATTIMATDDAAEGRNAPAQRLHRVDIRIRHCDSCTWQGILRWPSFYGPSPLKGSNPTGRVMPRTFDSCDTCVAGESTAAVVALRTGLRTTGAHSCASA